MTHSFSVDHKALNGMNKWGVYVKATITSNWPFVLTLLFISHYFCISVCSTTGPLGMITGDIKDWQITVSSAYPHEWDSKCREKYARVFLENKYGWCAKYKSSSEWLQVDLGVASRVSRYFKQLLYLLVPLVFGISIVATCLVHVQKCRCLM